ncbi:hypothetical protein ACFX15_039670 [Malus domestica]
MDTRIDINLYGINSGAGFAQRQAVSDEANAVGPTVESTDAAWVGEEDDDESALSQLGLRRNTSYTSSTASTASSAANGWGFSTWVSCTRASFARMTEIPASSPPKFASTQCGSGFFLRGFNMEASSTDQMSLIKQLRERTNAPIKDVKATLIDSNWDIEAAQKELRRKGKVSASKKSSRMAAEGMLALAQNENKLLLLNFNFETDFVAPNDIFQYLIFERINTMWLIAQDCFLRPLLRYYELGPDNPSYAAKFYDFCGAEDPEASSCTTSFHVSMMTIDPCNICLLRFIISFSLALAL